MSLLTDHLIDPLPTPDIINLRPGLNTRWLLHNILLPMREMSNACAGDSLHKSRANCPTGHGSGWLIAYGVGLERSYVFVRSVFDAGDESVQSSCNHMHSTRWHRPNKLELYIERLGEGDTSQATIVRDALSWAISDRIGA